MSPLPTNFCTGRHYSCIHKNQTPWKSNMRMSSPEPGWYTKITSTPFHISLSHSHIIHTPESGEAGENTIYKTDLLLLGAGHDALIEGRSLKVTDSVVQHPATHTLTTASSPTCKNWSNAVCICVGPHSIIQFAGFKPLFISLGSNFLLHRIAYVLRGSV